MLDKFFFADCHCDTLDITDESAFFDDNSTNNVSYKKLKEGNVKLQTFAICVPSTKYSSPYARCLELMSKYDKITSHSGIIKITDKKSLDDLQCSEKLGTLLALEGCDAIENGKNVIDEMYKRGVRILSLTWNNSNSFSGGICANDSGLTQSGRELVLRCNDMGILVDVSHISEKGFWDIASVSSKPFVATHSNAKRICNNKRNLSDEQLLALKASGGCVGINFYPPFLSDNGMANADDVICHIEYISGLIGASHIAIGSDFDGVCNNLPLGIASSRDLYKIRERLLKLNYSQEDTDGICGKNFLRVLSLILK